VGCAPPVMPRRRAKSSSRSRPGQIFALVEAAKTAS
jgi:hypothetical protein